MLPETRHELAALVLEMEDCLGRVACLLAADPDISPPDPDPLSSDDPTLCEHPEGLQNDLLGRQLMCMACGASKQEDGTWLVI